MPNVQQCLHIVDNAMLNEYIISKHAATENEEY